MSHVTIEDVAKTVSIQPGAVVSKVIHRDDDLDVTVFAFDAGFESDTRCSLTPPFVATIIHPGREAAQTGAG